MKSGNKTSAGPNGNGNGLSRLASYLYWGAGIGVASSLAMLFVVVFFYGQSMGLSTGACALLSCVSTILLSQPAGIIGIVAGALVGIACGYAGHAFRTT
jgi:hypothetical protein